MVVYFMDSIVYYFLEQQPAGSVGKTVEKSVLPDVPKGIRKSQ